MDQKPLISIIIPVYNHKEALFKALFALSCQTYRPIEIIIIDDGSNEPLRVPKKQVSIDRFQEDDNVRVFVGNLI